MGRLDELVLNSTKNVELIAEGGARSLKDPSGKRYMFLVLNGAHKHLETLPGSPEQREAMSGVAGVDPLSMKAKWALVHEVSP